LHARRQRHRWCRLVRSRERNTLMRTTSRIVNFLFFALLVSSLALARAEGEGENKEEKKPTSPGGEVNGKITLADGKALPAGMITFHGRDVKDTVRVTVDDGKYVARNVPAGKTVRVTIEVEPINALAEGMRD